MKKTFAALALLAALSFVPAPIPQHARPFDLSAQILKPILYGLSVSGGGGGGITILSGSNGHVNCSGAGPCTTSGIDTTGASLIACDIAGFSGTIPVVTDSKSNIWHSAPPTFYFSNSTSINIQWVYAQAPTVGSGQTFTGTGGGGAMSLVCLAFSGVNATAYVASSDMGQINQSTVGGLIITPGAFSVPANDLEVTAIGYAFGTTNTATVDNGGSGSAFNNIENVSNAAAIGQSVSFKVVPGTASFNPGWTTASGVTTSVNAASFAHQ